MAQSGAAEGRTRAGASPAARTPVPRPDPGRGWAQARDVVWTLLGVAGLVYVAGWALKWVAAVLLLFVLSALLAFVVRPLVVAIERRLGTTRTRAALLAYGLVVAAVVAAGAWVVSALVTQATAAVASLPAMYQAVEERIPDLQQRAAALGIEVDVRALQARLLDELQGAGLAAHGLAWASALGDAALNGFMVLFL